MGSDSDASEVAHWLVDDDLPPFPLDPPGSPRSVLEAGPEFEEFDFDVRDLADHRPAPSVDEAPCDAAYIDAHLSSIDESLTDLHQGMRRIERHARRGLIAGVLHLVDMLLLDILSRRLAMQ